MRIYIMTDLEGVTNVMDFENWCTPDGRYYELGKELLTREVNAAIEGLIAGGATEIVVADGHGHGGINGLLLDSRVELMRGWPTRYSLLLDEAPTRVGYGAIAWVGQHAKAGTPFAHLAHTQSFRYVDLSINGASIGEFGQMALCAGELGIPCILLTGDRAVCSEGEALAPGIETVEVKRGTTPGSGDDLPTDAYAKRNLSAIHWHPEQAREAIRAGAERAARRLTEESLGLVTLDPPYERVARFRGDAERPATISVERHESSIIALLNLPYDPRPMAERS